MALSLACIPTTAFAGSMMVSASPHAATHANKLAFVTYASIRRARSARAAPSSPFGRARLCETIPLHNH